MNIVLTRWISGVVGAAFLFISVQARSAGPYDGTYTSVSVQAQGANNCPMQTAPKVTIANSQGQATWRNGSDVFQGEVGATGAIVLRSPQGFRLQGQIDGQAQLKGSIYSSNGGCVYQIVWKRG